MTPISCDFWNGDLVLCEYRSVERDLSHASPLHAAH